MPHQFKFFHAYQLDAMTPEQLHRAELEDRVLCMPSLADIDFDFPSMTDDDLRELLGQGPKPVALQTIPTLTPKRTVRPRPTFPAPPRVKAQIWWQGKNHDLGWYMTEQVRDEVVAEARTLRSMGLDPRMAKKTK